ncbi:type II toxin-antitoxin system RelE family toxin [Phormidesmis sp. 146-35]
MSYQVELSPSARRQLKKLPSDIQAEVLQALTDLAADPRPMGIAKMSGDDAYRIRVGKYRVVYEIYDEVLIVIVVKIGHRREVYR